MITEADNRVQKVIGMTIWMIPVITLLYNGIARLVNTGAGHGEPVHGIHVLWNRLTIHGYRKLSAKGKAE